MKKIEIKSSYELYDSMESLNQEDKALLEKAIEVRETAYAPYSKFKVGTAILLENGTYVLGSNQENAAYPSGLCAERVALFAAGAQHPGVTIKKMALTAKSPSQVLKNPISSCGACRQSIAEYEIKQQQPIEIIFMGETGKVAKVDSVKTLLPLLFESSSL